LSHVLKRKYEVLERYLEEVRRELDLKLVILFGSLVKGDWREDSDIDLLIVGDGLSDDPGENFTRLKRYCIDPHAFSTKRFLEELQRPNLLILDALQYGRRITADEGFTKMVEELFEGVKRRFGLRWTGETWSWR